MTFPKLEAALTEIKSLIKGITESSVITNVNSKIAELESAISGELATAKATITELTAKLTDSDAALEKAQGEANAFGAKVKALNEKFDSTITSLKLEIAADAGEEAKLEAVVGAVNAAIEKTGVDLSKLPGAPVGALGKRNNIVSREDFKKMSPAAQSEFCRNGGRITDK